MSKRPSLRQQDGFTILELLIATAVLSVILLVVTVSITGIGNLYYKGINQARVQDTTRSISTDLAQHLQLSNAGFDQAKPSTDGTEGVLCLGNTRYTYVVNVQIGKTLENPDDSPVNRIFYQHVLWRDNVSGGCSIGQPATLTAPNPDANTGVANPGVVGSGSELIAPNSRLTAFSVDGTSPYQVTVGVAYGDTDTLNINGASTTCKNGAGDQFCAISSLTTTVLQRVTGSN